MEDIPLPSPVSQPPHATAEDEDEEDTASEESDEEAETTRDRNDSGLYGTDEKEVRNTMVFTKNHNFP